MTEKPQKSYVLAEVPVDSKVAGYEPRGGARELWNSHDPEVIIEGPSETGKTLAALEKIDALCWKYPESQMVMMRKTQRSVYESCLQTFTHKVLKQGPQWSQKPIDVVKPWGGVRPEMFIYPNGSVIWIAGLDSADKVLSSERDIIYVNQCEEFSLNEWETLTTRATGRAGHVKYPQLIGDCNPSAPLHWILARAKAGSLRLIHSSHEDNPALWDAEKKEWTGQGKRTMAVLEKLTGSRRSRLLQGLWTVPEGVIYGMFDEKTNMVNSFIPPNVWPRVVGVDPKGAYIGALWGAWDQANKQLHIYREYVQPFGITTSRHVDNILSLTKSSGETVWRWWGGGPSERQERLDFLGHGIPLEEVEIKSVWVGVDKVAELLADKVLVIHDCCIELLSEVGTYRRIVDRSGFDSDEIENKESYHLLDALRYLVCGLVGPAEGEEHSQLYYVPISIGKDF